MNPRGAGRPNASPSGSDKSYLFGRQPVIEALQAARRRIIRLHLQDTLLRSGEFHDVIDAVRAARGEVSTADRGVLDRLTQGGHHQGLVLEVGPYPYVSLKELLQRVGETRTSLWLILDHLMDPHNVGAVLRTADAAGVAGVVIPADRAVGITDAVVRASAGASEHVQICREVNIVRAMKQLQEHGVWLYGLEALPEAKELGAADLSGNVGLVLGSEGEGLGRLVRETCDFLLKIPMCGRVNSLNVSVAGAVAMYEVLRQSRGGGEKPKRSAGGG